MYAKSVDEKMDLLMKAVILNKKHKLESLISRLDAASPLERLKAGMAYISDESGKRISGVTSLKENDSIKITMKDGYAYANINTVVWENL